MQKVEKEGNLRVRKRGKSRGTPSNVVWKRKEKDPKPRSDLRGGQKIVTGGKVTGGAPIASTSLKENQPRIQKSLGAQGTKDKKVTDSKVGERESGKWVVKVRGVGISFLLV